MPANPPTGPAAPPAYAPTGSARWSFVIRPLSTLMRVPGVPVSSSRSTATRASVSFVYEKHWVCMGDPFVGWMERRSSARPAAGNSRTESSPAPTSAAASPAPISPSSRPIAVAATRNGSDVACSRPATSASRRSSSRW